jgi:anti-sigma B factor antagonist
VKTGEPEGLRLPPVQSVERRDGVVVVHLAGELDLYNSAEVGAALADAGDGSAAAVVVDLGEVSFVDSTALGTLVEAKKNLPDGVRFALAAPTADVRRALEVSGLAQHFDVRDSVDAALA